MTKYKIGSIISGTITGIEKYGIFVNLDNYYSGLIHISEISDSFVNSISDYAKIGDTIKAKIIEINEDNCHIKLSIKGLNPNINKIEKVKIKEIGSGFEILKENLNTWIEEKIKNLK